MFIVGAIAPRWYGEIPHHQPAGGARGYQLGSSRGREGRIEVSGAAVGTASL